MWIVFFREHDDYKFSRSQQFFFLHARFSEFFWEKLIIAMNIDETVCCENILDNVFCVLSRCKMWFEKYDTNLLVQKFFVSICSRSCEMWFEKYDTNFLIQKLFVTICSRDLVWSFHRQYFDCLVSSKRMTYTRFRLIERRVCFWWDDSNDRISSNWKRFIIWERFKNDSNNRISSNCERFIKFDKSDLSSLMRTIRERWWNEISSNLWESEKFHQTWRICIDFSDK